MTKTPSKTSTTSTTAIVVDKPFVDIVREHEETSRGEVLISMSNLRAAQDLVPSTAEDLADAEDAVSAIQGSWRALSDEHTPQDYAVAQAAVVRAQQRERGAARNLERCQRAASSTDTSLSDGVAPAVERALPGVTVLSTFADVARLPRPRLAELPVVVIRHSKGAPAKLDADGYFDGEVELTYFRSSIHRGLDAQALEEAADTLGQALEAVGMPTARGEGVEVLRMRASVSPSLPYLPSIATFNYGRIGTGLSSAVVDRFNHRGHAVSFDLDSQSHSNDLIVAMSGSKLVHEEELDEATGERVLTVNGTLLVSPRSQVDMVRLADAVAAVADDWRLGVHVGGLGRVTDFRLVSAGDSPAAISKAQADVEVKRSPYAKRQQTDVSDWSTTQIFAWSATVVSTTVRPHTEPEIDAA